METTKASTSGGNLTENLAAPRNQTNIAALPKADLGKRFLAALIDGIIAAVASAIPLIGGIAGAAYMVVRDGLDVEFMQNRSLGKKVMNLQPVMMDGSAVDVRASVMRNWMWGIGALTGVLLYIPILGWILIPIVAVIALGIGIFEIYKVLTDEGGRRWGDTLADTKVIEVDA